MEKITKNKIWKMAKCKQTTTIEAKYLLKY